jgi:quercetin dioxygenase-like cupin family protein
MLALLVVAGLITAQQAGSQEPRKAGPEPSELGEMRVFPAGKVEWRSGPESLPPGAQVAVLEGDPSSSGPFVFRVKAPDGYTIPPHTHPKAERVTVIAGTFHIAMTDKVDKSAGQAMPAGSFGYWPAGMKHFAWVSGETIVQFHGIGPWQINYLNPADDPRNAKKP